MIAGSGHAGLSAIINTEEKQLLAIEDLYEIVKAQPAYKTLKEPSWSADTSPLIVIQWLLRKLGPLALGNNWTIDTYLEGKKTRYRFVVYKYYPVQNVGFGTSHRIGDIEEYLPVDFLPMLKNRDLLLHDLIVDIIALVSKHNKIPLWDEDGDFSRQMQGVLRDGTHEIESLKAQKLSYSKGDAARYLALIKRRRRQVSFDEVTHRISLFANRNDTRRTERLTYWLRAGIELAREGGNILENSFVPNYQTSPCITPYRQFKFVWSLHKNDVVVQRTFSKLKKDSKTGLFLPCMSTVGMPGRRMKTLKENDFGIELYQFMHNGFGIFLGTHRQYFYKDQLEDPKTPAEKTLLKIIEEYETRQPV